MKVLLVKPSSFGDIIHALPVAHALHGAGAEVDWVLNPEFAPLLEDNPSVKRLLLFPRRNPSEIPAFVRALRSREYDLAIDLQGLFRTGLVMAASRAKRKMGMSDAREGAGFFYNATAPIRSGHAIERYLQTLDYAGVTRGELQFPLPFAEPPQAVAGIKDYIVIHPFSRWPTKELPHELIQALVQKIHPRPVIIAGQGQCLIPPGATDLTNRTTLKQLIGLLRGASAVLSTDSGPLHLAAALGRPLVALFGPTTPGKTGPWTPNARVLQISSEELPCIPCHSRQCRNSVHRACLRRLTADEILGCLPL